MKLNKNSRSRSAHHGIKGYLYQFIKTIESILQLKKNENLTVEGHEDIDIHGLCESTLIQCIRRQLSLPVGDN